MLELKFPKLCGLGVEIGVGLRSELRDWGRLGGGMLEEERGGLCLITLVPVFTTGAPDQGVAPQWDFSFRGLLPDFLECFMRLSNCLLVLLLSRDCWLSLRGRCSGATPGC